MSLKSKAIKSFNWTTLELVFNQGTVFLVGIILARILPPKDFGVIGIITVFLAISNSIVEGGFGSALIRKTDANNDDYNTVFYSNLFIGTILYIVLLLTSKLISDFFGIPILRDALNISGLVLILNGLSIIHRTILTKKLNFKLLALIAIIASIVSGVFSIYMAYHGYGIWSLVLLLLLRPIIQTILFWIINKWRPQLIFSKKNFKNLFDYGYKVLISSLINTLYKNIYYILIGKLFSPTSLGLYTRAEQFQSPISGNITRAINKISFPILSNLQEDNVKLKSAFVKFLKFSFFLTCIIMAAIAATAKPLVLLLVGNKWYDSIFYLQLMCVPGILYPLQILHLNLLLVKGLSNLNLKLEIIKKIILLPLIYYTALISINAMLYGLVIFSIIEYFINSYFTNRLIDYPLKKQIIDLIPRLGISTIMFCSMYCISFLNISLLKTFILQIFVGVVIFFVINEILKLEEYKEIKLKTIDILKKF